MKPLKQKRVTVNFFTGRQITRLPNSLHRRKGDGDFDKGEALEVEGVRFGIHF